MCNDVIKSDFATMIHRVVRGDPVDMLNRWPIDPVDPVDVQASPPC